MGPAKPPRLKVRLIQLGTSNRLKQPSEIKISTCQSGLLVNSNICQSAPQISVAGLTPTILIYNNVYNSSAGSAEYDGIHTELLYAVPRFDDGESS
ncbi:hypothetical protein KCU92_g85, partial [Aureobasidium melanogenum]